MILRTAIDAARVCVELAEEAAREGTFGVGALLIDSVGRSLVHQRNRVVKHGQTNDPTAHAERLIVDWYYSQLNLGVELPAPSECTIVSSLDPCIHCAGAILSAGFKAVSLAPDSDAGVFAQNEFGCLPLGLRKHAAQTFYRFKIEGLQPRENTTSCSLPFFDEQVVPTELYNRARKAFLTSLDTVRHTISGGRRMDLRPTTTTSDPVDVQADVVADNFDEDMLRKLDKFFYLDSRDFAAFVDPVKQFLFGAFDKRECSPVRTAFAELTREYARLLKLSGNYSHPRNCILITKFAPEPNFEGLVTVGAYGSTMEASLPAVNYDRWIHIFPLRYQDSKWIDELPPLYSQVVRIAPRYVAQSRFLTLNGLYVFTHKLLVGETQAQGSTKRIA